jgi:hypothetical protein
MKSLSGVLSDKFKHVSYYQSGGLYTASSDHGSHRSVMAEASDGTCRVQTV